MPWNLLILIIRKRTGMNLNWKINQSAVRSPVFPRRSVICRPSIPAPHSTLATQCTGDGQSRNCRQCLTSSSTKSNRRLTAWRRATGRSWRTRGRRWIIPTSVRRIAAACLYRSAGNWSATGRCFLQSWRWRDSSQRRPTASFGRLAFTKSLVSPITRNNKI